MCSEIIVFPSNSQSHRRTHLRFTGIQEQPAWGNLRNNFNCDEAGGRETSDTTSARFERFGDLEAVIHNSRKLKSIFINEDCLQHLRSLKEANFP